MKDIIPVKWDEIKNRVKTIDPTFYEILDTDPSIKKEIFHIYRYKYGEMVGDEDYHYQPNKVLTKNFWQMPFSMIISKEFTFTLNCNNNILFEQKFCPGDFIFVSKVIPDSNDQNNVTAFIIEAGARSPIFINVMTNDVKHKKIKRHLAGDVQKPTDLKSHFYTIKDIARLANSDWRAELLAFPDNWINKIKAKKSSPFIEYVYNYYLKHTSYQRYAHNNDMLLLHINKIKNQNVYQNSFKHRIIQNIFNITCGEVPAYALATTDDSIPLKLVEDVYLNYYQPDFAPLIFTPSAFRNEPDRTHYFSMAKHASLYKPNAITSTLGVCYDVQELFKEYSKLIRELNYSPETMFYHVSQNLELPIIHERKGDGYSSGKSILISEIDTYDHDIKQHIEELSSNGTKYTLPKRAEFFRGVFGLDLKKK